MGVVAQRDAPPPVLDSARVLAYAIVNESVQWTGRQTLFVDGKELGQVPRLALCQNVWGSFRDIHLFHCSDQWEVLGASGTPTLDLEQAKADAEHAYRGIGEKWIDTGISEDGARAWIREQSSEACSFCDRIPPEIDRLIQGRSGAICNHCVAELYAKAMLPDPGPDHE